MDADLPTDLLQRFRARFDPAQVAENAFHDSNDVLLFVHIPKTAGMSVGRSLQESFDKFHGIAWNNIKGSFQQTTERVCYERKITPARRVMMGHFSWTEVSKWHAYGLPVKCGTILRDPVDRAISQYNYNCSPAHPPHERFKGEFPTLESYVERLPFDFQLNAMIGPSYSFEQALEKLIANYSFIGVTEHLSKSLAHLARSHGSRPMTEHRINVAKSEEKAPIPADIREIVERKSHHDGVLHRMISAFYA